MPFRVKDLMINVVPAAGAGQQAICQQFTCFPFSCFGFSCFHFTCQHFTICPQFTCHPITFIAQPAAQIAPEQAALGAGVAPAACPANTVSPCVLQTLAPCPAHTVSPCVLHTFVPCPLNTISPCTLHTCPAHSVCLIPTCHINTIICPQFTCPVGTCIPTVVGPPGTIVDPGPISQQLAAAKQALQSQLAELEKQEKELEESLRPQTVAEVEELEKKLQEGLEELRKRKADLQKAPPKSK